MRYRVEKIEFPIPDTEDEKEVKLQATIWPGPFAFAKTDEEKMNKEVAVYAGDGNITFLAGQFFQAIQILDEYGIDGNE